MKESTLETLAPLLNLLRSYDVLDEVRETSFQLNGRDFIHFHDESDGLWADVRLSKGRIRVAISTPSEQAELIEKISPTLDELESRRGGNRKRQRRRGR